MFAALGRAVAEHPLVCLLLWAALAAGLAWSGPSAESVAAAEPGSLLPDDQPYNRALELAGQAFPQISARTRTILIFERPTGLTPADFDHLEQTARRLSAQADGRWRVLAPSTHPFLKPRLVSADGQAAMILVNQDDNYLTRKCVSRVEAIEAAARTDLPEGLTLDVTGEGGLGRDVSRAGSKAYHRTTWVTIAAVLIILVLVYRAPLAAAVPLVSIGISVHVALQLLNRLAAAGWAVSDLERTFVVVLMFGSGTDFAMFWLARYREESPYTDAAHRGAAATVGTGPAIVASALTTIIGLSMLVSADLSPTHNAGRALGFALAISMMAALTLTPAAARLMGGSLFWPRRPAVSANAGTVWSAIAGGIVRRPGLMLVGVAAMLAWPAWEGARIDYRYDAFGVASSDSSAARGQATAEKHFTPDALFSWTVLVECPPESAAGIGLDTLAAELGARCATIEGLTDVWSLDAPLGKSVATRLIPRAMAAGSYISPDPPCIRVEVMQPFKPLSTGAMDLCSRVMAEVGSWAADRIGPGAAVHGIGLTPYIINVRHVSDADQRRIMVRVGLAVAVVVLIWIRRPVLTLCMVGATLVLYLTTLGIADQVFGRGLPDGGLDWKIKLLLFVIMLAVGQDYNIFLVSRIVQERRSAGAREATARALTTTGPVISGCGLIMAATLGSLAAGGPLFYRQLGFAFALGILLDTFVIRPVVVPACYLLGEAAGRKRSRSPRCPPAGACGTTGTPFFPRNE
ncbi:MAG: MMPL family transporter [Phycisphaerales bacterium]|nr:MAG: MMPL family transporter [Phycisphaerales bacterium]